MKSVNEALTFFADTLEAEQELQFDMSSWYRNTHFYDQPTSKSGSPVFTQPKKVANNVCGTAACLAGTVAYRLDPNSSQPCTDIVIDWVGDEYYVSLALEELFKSPKVYGARAMHYATKDAVIMKLRELAIYGSWEELYKCLP